MDQDRIYWGVREYADALNRAATPAELFELAQEVNEKWTAADDLRLTSRGRGQPTSMGRQTRSATS